MSEGPSPKRREPRYPFLALLVVLAAALAYGWTHHAPDVRTPAGELFPDAVELVQRGLVFVALDTGGNTLGWASTGTANGYGGAILVVAGIDTLGQLVGVRVVEQRETPIFWRMVRAPDYFDAVTGSSYDQVDYDYPGVVGVTGATRSADAVVASLRRSVARIADPAFNVRLPAPVRPFEFGLLELAALLLIVAGVTAHRLGGALRRRLRWAAQLTGLIIIGFWEASPISLSKITAMASGYLPDPRTTLAIYILVAGFLVTSLLYDRNIYCLYACPFGAAQRCVGVIGGKSIRMPRRLARGLEWTRNTAVFALVFMAFLTLQPALVTYEPFSALFSLRGTTLQWLLLAVVLVTSLVIHTPWCNYLCPMRSIEVLVQRLKGQRVRIPGAALPPESRETGDTADRPIE